MRCSVGWRNMPAMKQRRKWFTATLLVALLGLAPWFAAAQTATTQTTSADLPVTRLALFTSGVGYFEHEGVVSGDQELVLTVPKAEMDDLLQSLVLQDFGGGTIEPVRYSSRAPLGRLLDGSHRPLRQRHPGGPVSASAGRTRAPARPQRGGGALLG